MELRRGPLLAAAALFVVAGSARAVTCTIDQRPAATLLIPYFQATFNPDGTILATGPNALDTLVTIGNASPDAMLASVTVFSERSEAVMSFNIALTGFDVQSFSMASVLEGNLPVTPVNISHVAEVSDSHQVRFSGKKDKAQQVRRGRHGLKIGQKYFSRNIPNGNGSMVFVDKHSAQV